MDYYKTLTNWIVLICYHFEKIIVSYLPIFIMNKRVFKQKNCDL